ncbi:MAG: N-acetylmuramoyl-L-alanine amidase [Ruminococcaceae bacterium]|nr:N-acetylmuramoyl-L-alanine amidase [Oscillospiraceae bacterium]
MKQKTNSFLRGFSAFLLLFGIFCGILTYLSPPPSIPTPVVKDPAERITTVVLDAGHGGEDGGAVSACGLVEKEINLKITLLLKDMLTANGVNVVLTRETDTLLYDRNVDYHGRKKVLDLAARKKIAEETEESVFVSIHMNTHPIVSCQGLQVWYSPNDLRSKILAETIQKTTHTLLQPQNDRTVKAANSSIYLLHKLNTPAILIECGFLSNPEEARKLGDEEYQKQLALSIFLSIMETDFSS